MVTLLNLVQVKEKTIVPMLPVSALEKSTSTKVAGSLSSQWLLI